MKKRISIRRLRLRKDTLLALEEDTMHQVGGAIPIDFTEGYKCVVTTISPDCVHNESVGCPTTFTPTW